MSFKALEGKMGYKSNKLNNREHSSMQIQEGLQAHLRKPPDIQMIFTKKT